MLNYGVDFLIVHEEREIKVDNDDIVWAAPLANAYFLPLLANALPRLCQFRTTVVAEMTRLIPTPFAFFLVSPLLCSFAATFFSDQLCYIL